VSKATKATKASAGKEDSPAKGVKMLAGGNPQIAKGDGEAPVQAYIAALSGWKQEVARAIDAAVVAAVPGVTKAVKWNSPFYGVPGNGWFLSVHAFSRYVKVAFFKGGELSPLPPGESTRDTTRYLDVYEAGIPDKKQLTAWIKQAAAMPGWLA
jgi:hypothetical protein